jgi:hypothetical protein
MLAFCNGDEVAQVAELHASLISEFYRTAIQILLDVSINHEPDARDRRGTA